MKNTRLSQVSYLASRTFAAVVVLLAVITAMGTSVEAQSNVVAVAETQSESSSSATLAIVLAVLMIVGIISIKVNLALRGRYNIFG